jgi:hypothetical protein
MTGRGTMTGMVGETGRGGAGIRVTSTGTNTSGAGGRGSVRSRAAAPGGPGLAWPAERAPRGKKRFTQVYDKGWDTIAHLAENAMALRVYTFIAKHCPR